MTVYAKIENGAVAVYPYSLSQLRKDNPQVSFPRSWDASLLAEYGVHEVAQTAKPVYDPITQNVVEGTPSLVNSVWMQVWNVVAASAEEIAARQEAAAQQAELEAGKLDAWVVSYLAMTPAEAEQYVLNNAANLSQLRGIVSKLAYSVRVLIRREFNR